MADEKNNSFALLTIVAVVAIVGIVVLIKSGGSMQPTVYAAVPSEAGNTGGMAYQIPTITHSTSSRTMICPDGSSIDDPTNAQCASGHAFGCVCHSPDQEKIAK